MGTRSGIAFIGLLAAVLAASCNGGGGSSTGPSTGTRLTLAGNSVSRTLFEKGLIPAFEASYAKAHPGYTVQFTQSYEGSGAQARAIEAGLKADVAALSLAPEIDKLCDEGLAPKDWSNDANHGVPATSLVVLIVRKGNPKSIKDWSDLARNDVDLVLPNPDTSGAAKWNIAAINGGLRAEKDWDDKKMVSFLGSLRSRIKAFGKSGKEAQQIFSSGLGDVLVGWESEAMERSAAGDQIEIVYPDSTLQMEPPVAVITPKGQASNVAAAEFVKFLSTAEAQRIYAQNYYRPRDPEVSKEFASTFPRVKDLLTIEKLGGWKDVQGRLFGTYGLWDLAAQK